MRVMLFSISKLMKWMDVKRVDAWLKKNKLSSFILIILLIGGYITQATDLISKVNSLFARGQEQPSVDTLNLNYIKQLMIGESRESILLQLGTPRFNETTVTGDVLESIGESTEDNFEYEAELGRPLISGDHLTEDIFVYDSFFIRMLFSDQDSLIAYCLTAPDQALSIPINGSEQFGNAGIEKSEIVLGVDSFVDIFGQREYEMAGYHCLGQHGYDRFAQLGYYFEPDPNNFAAERWNNPRVYIGEYGFDVRPPQCLSDETETNLRSQAIANSFCVALENDKFELEFLISWASARNGMIATLLQ